MVFDYTKLFSLFPSTTNPDKLRYGRVIVPPKFQEYFEAIKVTEVKTTSTFHSDDNIEIHIVYGKSDFAVAHEVINNKHCFFVFPDFVFNRHDMMKMFEIVKKSIEYILSYIPYCYHAMVVDTLYPIIKDDNDDTVKSIIKDTFAESIQSDIELIAIYAVWSIIGAEKFLERYRQVYPYKYSIEELESLMKAIDIGDAK